MTVASKCIQKVLMILKLGLRPFSQYILHISRNPEARWDSPKGGSTKPQKTGCRSSPPQDASSPALLNGKLPNPASFVELNRFPASEAGSFKFSDEEYPAKDI